MVVHFKKTRATSIFCYNKTDYVNQTKAYSKSVI